MFGNVKLLIWSPKRMAYFDEWAQVMGRSAYILANRGAYSYEDLAFTAARIRVIRNGWPK